MVVTAVAIVLVIKIRYVGAGHVSEWLELKKRKKREKRMENEGRETL